MPDTQGHHAAAKVRAAAADLLAEVERQPPALIHWKPAPDVWSIMEILSHVREFVPYWTAQALQIAHHPEQQWGRDHRDTARLAALEHSAERKLAEVTGAIREVVRSSAEAIEGLSDAALASEAVSRNPRWGRKPASFVVEDLVIGHVVKHLGQVRRNVEQFQQRGTAAQ